MKTKAPCRLCGSLHCRKMENKKNGLLFYHCLDCAYRFKAPSLLPEQQKERERYLEHNNSPTQKGYIDFLTYFLQTAVFPFCGKGQGRSALDWGCGPSPVLADIMKSQRWEISYFDPFFQIDQKVFNQQYFLITATEVLEHLHYPLQSIKKVLSCLQPGGFFCIMTSFYPLSQGEFVNWWYTRDPSHCGFFSPPALEFLAKECNFVLLWHDNYRLAVFRKTSRY